MVEANAYAPPTRVKERPCPIPGVRTFDLPDGKVLALEADVGYMLDFPSFYDTMFGPAPAVKGA